PQAAHPRTAVQEARRGGGESAIFVDTHLHIDELGDATEVVQQAVASGVTRLIAVGTNIDRSSNAVSLGHAYEEVWAGVGYHPLEPSEPHIVAMHEMAKAELIVSIA